MQMQESVNASTPSTRAVAKDRTVQISPTPDAINGCNTETPTAHNVINGINIVGRCGVPTHPLILHCQARSD